MSRYLIPILFLIIYFYAIIKKVKPYHTFTEGAKSALPFAFSIFPYLVSIFLLTELFEISGLSDIIVSKIAIVFKSFGIPKELCKLMLIKPFSGSGSLALLSDIFTTYGTDSYIARCASVIYGSSETVFYVAAVYFAGAKTKKLFLPIIISLVSTAISCVFACFLCHII
jgi:spore maturation protein B